jgi:hypothetical protein
MRIPGFSDWTERFQPSGLIPSVDSEDLTAALSLFVEARSLLSGSFVGAKVGSPELPLSFRLEDLAERCSPGSDALALAVRGLVLTGVLEIDHAKASMRDSRRDDAILKAVSVVPLSLAQLEEPEAILKRIEGMLD